MLAVIRLLILGVFIVLAGVFRLAVLPVAAISPQ